MPRQIFEGIPLAILKRIDSSKTSVKGKYLNSTTDIIVNNNHSKYLKFSSFTNSEINLKIIFKGL